MSARGFRHQNNIKTQETDSNTKSLLELILFFFLRMPSLYYSTYFSTAIIVEIHRIRNPFNASPHCGIHHLPSDDTSNVLAQAKIKTFHSTLEYCMIAAEINATVNELLAIRCGKTKLHVTI